MISLNESITSFLMAKGVDELAFADLSSMQTYLHDEYGDKWLAYPRAVVVAVHFPTAIVQELLHGPSHTYLAYYDIVNHKINECCLLLTNYLAKAGYAAYPIPASQRISRDKLAGIFSHRLAAYAGGLGWIGKSGNLITEKNGPRLRLGTVLTDAPLICGQPMANRCADCDLCQKICPAAAIDGTLWQISDSICSHVDALACHNYLMKVRQSFGKRICGLCLAVCPYGYK